MRYLAMVLAGLLLAAAVHLMLMAPEERGPILRVTRAPAANTGGLEPRDAGTATTAVREDAAAARGPGVRRAQPSVGMPVDTGTAPGAATPAPALPSGLVVPVQGVAPAQLASTFEDARGGGRVHEALDIMAPAGTPVLAVADGHVEKLFDSRQGGLTIYQFEPGGRHAYYYAHLERYAPGLAEGMPVRRGQVIGYVGSTGNADPAAPHLHFAIFALGPGKRWWEGTPIDPWPLLSGEAR